MGGASRARPAVGEGRVQAGEARLSEGAIEALLEQALARHRAGDRKAAERLYRAALARAPGHPRALHRLGVLTHEQGRAKEAERLLREAVRRAPREPFLHNDLGEVLRAQARFEEAAACCRRALELAPGCDDAHHNLGLALGALGRLSEAAECFEAALGAAPACDEARLALGDARFAMGDFVGACQAYAAVPPARPLFAAAQARLARAERAAGRLHAARRALREAIGAAPGSAEAWVELAELEEQAERFEAVVEAARRALALAPDDALTRGRLGLALRTLGRSAEAVGELERALALDDRTPALHNALGLARQDRGELAAARAAFERALALDPDYARARLNLAGVLLAEGCLEEARAAVERALELEPDYAPAWEMLADLAPEAVPAEALAGLLERADRPASQRAAAHFALARLFETREEHETAFHHLEQANRIERGEVDYDRQSHERHVEGLTAAFSAERMRRGLPGASASETPVFVVGMPRSGTTLVEQILAAHPEAHGRGELAFFHRLELRDAKGERRTYWDLIDELTPDVVASIATAYLNELLSGAPEAHRVVDKMPTNFLHLGLIALVFPRARIVYCRREPMAVGFSIFRQHFRRDLPFARDLADIGHYHRQHERLMAHWRAVLPGRLFELDYERLVRDPQATVRRLLAACGLDWHPQCLRFHERRRPVLTASQHQVRRPIYGDALDRWRRYEPWLGRLRQALAGRDGEAGAGP